MSYQETKDILAREMELRVTRIKILEMILQAVFEPQSIGLPGEAYRDLESSILTMTSCAPTLVFSTPYMASGDTIEVDAFLPGGRHDLRELTVRVRDHNASVSIPADATGLLEQARDAITWRLGVLERVSPSSAPPPDEQMPTPEDIEVDGGDEGEQVSEHQLARADEDRMQAEEAARLAEIAARRRQAVATTWQDEIPEAPKHDAADMVAIINRQLDRLGDWPKRSVLESIPGRFTEQEKLKGVLDEFDAIRTTARECCKLVPNELWKSYVASFMSLVAARIRGHQQVHADSLRRPEYGNLVRAMTLWAGEDRPGFIYGLSHSHDAPEEGGWQAQFDQAVKVLRQVASALVPPAEEETTERKSSSGVTAIKRPRKSDAPAPPWKHLDRTRGMNAVIISGDYRAEAMQRIKSQLELEAIDWIEGGDQVRLASACERIERGTYDLVIETRAYIPHSASDAVRKACDNADDVLFVTSRKYGVAEIKHMIERSLDPKATPTAA